MRLLRLWRDRSGAVLLETALVMPALMLAIIGTIDFTMAMARQVYAKQLAMAGAQMAVAGGLAPVSDAQIQAQLASDSGWDASSFAIVKWTECNGDGVKLPQGPCPNDTDSRADFVQVTATTTYTPIFGGQIYSRMGLTQPKGVATGRMQ